MGRAVANCAQSGMMRSNLSEDRIDRQGMWVGFGMQKLLQMCTDIKEILLHVLGAFPAFRHFQRALLP